MADNPHPPADVVLARQKLAHRIAEALDLKWPNMTTEGYDIDEAREIIAQQLPMSAIEAEAEVAGIDEDPPPRQSGPSIIQKLRDAVGCDPGTLIGVIDIAARMITSLKQQVEAANEFAIAIIADGQPRFGLVAQGHIPTIAQMIGTGKTWQEIGTAIGWDPQTAKQHYDWHLEAAREKPQPPATPSSAAAERCRPAVYDQQARQYVRELEERNSIQAASLQTLTAELTVARQQLAAVTEERCARQALLEQVKKLERLYRAVQAQKVADDAAAAEVAAALADLESA